MASLCRLFSAGRLRRAALSLVEQRPLRQHLEQRLCRKRTLQRRVGVRYRRSAGRPARGLIWYSPILLLAIPGAAWFWRYARTVLIFSLALFLLYLLVYGKWYMWHGGYSWGPRFIVPALPFLALLSGPAWDAAVIQGRWGGVLGRVAVCLLAALSLGVQWLGMVIPFSLAQEWLATNVQPLFAPITFVRLAYSPLWAAMALHPVGKCDSAWWRAPVRIGGR